MAVDAQTTRSIVELITGGWRAQALYTAVKLKVADQISEGRATSREIAESTGADPDGIRRLMRLLIALEIFEGDESNGYRNTKLSEALLDSPQSLRDMCLLYGEEFYTAWGHAHHAISTTSSGFEVAYGKPLYSYMGQNPDIAKRFQHVMNAGSMFFDHVSEAFDFSGLNIVDVGGGGGHLLATVLDANRDATGILFDREHMIPEARHHLRDTVGLDRVQLVAGNMFDAVPAGGNVYILCRVLAGWTDDAVVEVFENCRRSLADSSSRLLVIDRLVDDDNPSALPALWDLHLLITTGGKHRTREAFTRLLGRAGFDIERATQLPMETTALVAAPRP